jgi:AraC-like DNA-binding protein
VQPGPRLNKRDSIRVKRERPRGILHQRAAEDIRGVARYWPSADLAPFVEHYWTVRWDVAEPRVTETLPHPCVHMVLEAGRSEIVGVMRTRFTRRLTGRGRVLGTRFRPGAFRAFVARPVSSFTGRRVPIADVFGAEARTLSERALRHGDDREAYAVVERFLRALKPRESDAMALAVRVAARIAEDRRITRAAQLTAEFGVSLRGLQRLCREHLGVGPKWVIQRHRLLEAAERVACGRIVDWADLALELGYSDQAHFIRDFKRLVGQSPAEYSRSLDDPPGSGPWWR